MSIKITALLNPFSSERKEFNVVPGQSIAEILKKIDTFHAVNSGWRVLIGGTVITDFSTVPADGEHVYIKLVPEGDNQEVGGGMKVGGGMLVVLGIIIAAAASWTGVGAGIGAALIGSGIGMLTGGTVLYNYQIPSLNDREKPEQDPSIRGSRNQMRPLGYIPVLFGRRRIYADLATSSYTWVDPADGSQYLYQLFCAGQKDQLIDKDTIKIDETLLKEYSASGSIEQVLAGTDKLLQMKIAYGEDTPPLVKKCVHEIQLNSLLKNKTDEGQDGSVVRTTPAGTTEINADIFFYSGLGKYNDKGNVEGTSVTLGAWYKQADEDDSAYKPLGFFAAGSNTIYGNELKTKRYAIHKTGLTADRWTVKISRLSGDSTDSKIVDAVYVGSIRAIKNEAPVSKEKCRRLTLIGLKIKASEKLNNIVEQLNFVSMAKLPMYTGNGSGVGAWEMRLTDNPASAALYVLRGDFSQQKLDKNEIDWPSFEKMYTWCASHGYGCNEYVAESMPVSSLLSAIASTCRADIFKSNGKMTVVQDIARDGFVQLFTPRNSHGYAETLVMADIPDSLALQFVDKDAGFAKNKLQVYNTPDGNRIKEPETSQDVQLWGVTDSAQTRKLGMYKYAVTKNRPIVHKFSADFEYLLAMKGDWIKYAGDIALAGITQGRITELIKDDARQIIGIKTDEMIPMETGKQYAVRIRKSDGSCMLLQLRTIAGSRGEVLFQLPVSENNGPREGDLFAFGTQGNEAIDLIITDIQAGENLSADITCVEYAPEIFAVDDPNFVLPDFKNNITDVPSAVDSGRVDLSGWQTWTTFHDGTAIPDFPTRDGSSGGWHRIATAESMWMSTKTARTIYEGVWSAPVPTGMLTVDQLLGGDTIIGKPDKPQGVTAEAERDGIEIKCRAQSDGLRNTIKKYVWEIIKGAQSSTIETTGAACTYVFNRKIDGYPETSDLTVWSIRVQAVNVYGKESEWSDTAFINLNNYGTWQPAAPEITSRVSGRNVTLFLSLAPRADGREVYGAPRYQVQIKREALSDPITGDPVAADTQFYKPATDKNYLVNENNYKDGTGSVVSDDVYMQVLPLYGQNKKDANESLTPSPIDTPYTFAVKAINESGKISESSDVRIIALATAARDLVNNAITNNKLAPGAVTADKIHAGTITANELYAGDLAAGGASFGKISAGGAGLQADKNNFWDLENQEFRIGNDIALEENGSDDAEYLHYKKDKGIFFKLKNFILSSISSVILGIFRVKSKGKEDRESFFIVNPTERLDDVTGTPAKTARVSGLMAAETFDGALLKGDDIQAPKGKISDFSAENLQVKSIQVDAMETRTLGVEAEAMIKKLSVADTITAGSIGTANLEASNATIGTLNAKSLSVQTAITTNAIASSGEVTAGSLTVIHNGWKATVQPCKEGVELIIYGGDNGVMKKKQIWTAIDGGVMNIFLHGNIFRRNNFDSKEIIKLSKSYDFIVYAKNFFVLVSYRNSIAFSNDAVRWTTVYAPYEFFSVACDGNTWVAVGKSICSSADLRSWIRRIQTSNLYLKAVAHGNGMWVTVGSDGVIATSPDGISWTPRSMYGMDFASVAYGEGTWIAVGPQGSMAISSDAISWRAISSIYAPLDMFRFVNFRSVAYHGGLWIVVHATGIFKSSDGVSWEYQDLSNRDLKFVTYNDDRWVITGEDKILSSSDATLWVTHELKGTAFTTIAFGRNTWVGVRGDDLYKINPPTVTWTAQ